MGLTDGPLCDSGATQQGLIRTNPLYRISDADAPPRVRATFQDLRRRLLPDVAMQEYVSAKRAAYDTKSYPTSQVSEAREIRL